MSRDELLERYHSYQRRLRVLHDRMITGLSREAIDRSARRLGMLEGSSTIVGEEGDLETLIDFALYRQPDEGGRTFIERYREGHPDHDEAELLAVMAAAPYALLRVTSVLSGGRVMVTSTRGSRPLLLMDEPMSRLGETGYLVAGNLLELPGFAMLSGTPIPLHHAAAARMLEAAERVEDAEGGLAEDELAVLTIRSFFADRDAAEPGWEAEEEDGPSRAERRAMGERGAKALPARKPARNAPCPCGSGRRYKACCGRR